MYQPKIKQKPPWRTGDIINFNKNCRKAECQLRKTKPQVLHNIFKENLTIYNKAIRNIRQAHFSKLISKDQNNPKMLFLTTDSLINPAAKATISSPQYKNQFAVFFRDKKNA